MEKLSKAQKIFEKFNKLVRRIYVNYSKNVLSKTVNPHDVYVVGNSKAYADTVVFPVMIINSYDYFIFTRVDEQENLIGVYVIPSKEFSNNTKLKWLTKKTTKDVTIGNEIYTKDDYVYFFQLKYADFEKFNNHDLVDIINEYRKNG